MNFRISESCFLGICFKDYNTAYKIEGSFASKMIPFQLLSKVNKACLLRDN